MSSVHSLLFPNHTAHSLLFPECIVQPHTHQALHLFEHETLQDSRALSHLLQISQQGLLHSAHTSHLGTDHANPPLYLLQSPRIP